MLFFIVNQPAALHLKGNIAAEMGGGTYLSGFHNKLTTLHQ